MGPFNREEDDEDILMLAEDDGGAQRAREALRIGLTGAIQALLEGITPENAGQRVALIGRLGTSGSRQLVQLGTGITGKPPVTGLLGNRETAGVESMKALIAAQAEANQMPLALRLRHLTEAHLHARNGGLTDVAVQIRAQIDAVLAGQSEPLRVPEVGPILGELADTWEEDQETPPPMVGYQPPLPVDS